MLNLSSKLSEIVKLILNNALFALKSQYKITILQLKYFYIFTYTMKLYLNNNNKN